MTTTPMPMNMTTTMMADADTTMTTTMTTSMTVTWLNLWDWQFSQGGLVVFPVVHHLLSLGVLGILASFIPRDTNKHNFASKRYQNSSKIVTLHLRV